MYDIQNAFYLFCDYWFEIIKYNMQYTHVQQMSCLWMKDGDGLHFEFKSRQFSGLSTFSVLLYLRSPFEWWLLLHIGWFVLFWLFTSLWVNYFSCYDRKCLKFSPSFRFYKNCEHPWWGIIFPKQPSGASYSVKIIWYSRCVCNPSPRLRQCIALFAVAKGWLLFDIGWFVFFWLFTSLWVFFFWLRPKMFKILRFLLEVLKEKFP